MTARAPICTRAPCRPQRTSSGSDGISRFTSATNATGNKTRFQGLLIPFQGPSAELTFDKNAFLYSRSKTGEYLVSAPFSKQTWAASIDSAGRPIESAVLDAESEGNTGLSGLGGTAKRWSALRSSPPLINSRLAFPGHLHRGQSKIVKGEWYLGGDVHGQIESASVREIQPLTGDLKSEFDRPGPAIATGVFSQLREIWSSAPSVNFLSWMLRPVKFSGSSAWVAN